MTGIKVSVIQRLFFVCGLIRKGQYVIWCTFQDIAKPFDGKNGDVLISSEAFEQAFFDSSIKQLILRNAFGLHRLPERTIVNQMARLLSLSFIYYRFLRKIMIWSIYAPYIRKNSGKTGIFRLMKYEIADLDDAKTAGNRG